MALDTGPADTDRRAVPERSETREVLGQQTGNGKGECGVATWETRWLTIGPRQARGLLQPFDAEKREKCSHWRPPEKLPPTAPIPNPQNQGGPENIEGQVECVAEKVAGKLRSPNFPEGVRTGDCQQCDAE